MRRWRSCYSLGLVVMPSPQAALDRPGLLLLDCWRVERLLGCKWYGATTAGDIWSLFPLFTGWTCRTAAVWVMCCELGLTPDDL